MMNSSFTSQPSVFLPNIVLDDSNYPTWLFRMESFLKSMQLFDLVDGTSTCPVKFIPSENDSTTVLNPKYAEWKVKDQSIINMLSQTLSPVAMSCAVGSVSASHMWSNLKQKFASSNRQNILQLKSNLHELKKGSDSIDVYLDKIKAARDALATVGVFLDDEDIVVTVLRGLPYTFAAIKTVIRSQSVSYSFPELRTLLKAAEYDIDQENGVIVSPLTAMLANSTISTNKSTTNVPPLISNTQSTIDHNVPLSSQTSHLSAPQATNFHNNLDPTQLNAMMANGQNRNSSSYASKPYTKPFSSTSICQLCNKPGHIAKTCNRLQQFHTSANTSSPVECQYCGRKYHTADKCYHLIGFPPGFTKKNTKSEGSQAQQNTTESINALVATGTGTLPTPFWIADSGASQHMTSEAQLLQNVVSYPTNETVTIGNGQNAEQSFV